jgi:hypothetical protein
LAKKSQLEDSADLKAILPLLASDYEEYEGDYSNEAGGMFDNSYFDNSLGFV